MEVKFCILEYLEDLPGLLVCHIRSVHTRAGCPLSWKVILCSAEVKFLTEEQTSKGMLSLLPWQSYLKLRMWWEM